MRNACLLMMAMMATRARRSYLRGRQKRRCQQRKQNNSLEDNAPPSSRSFYTTRTGSDKLKRNHIVQCEMSIFVMR